MTKVGTLEASFGCWLEPNFQTFAKVLHFLYSSKYRQDNLILKSLNNLHVGFFVEQLCQVNLVPLCTAKAALCVLRLLRDGECLRRAARESFLYKPAAMQISQKLNFLSDGHNQYKLQLYHSPFCVKNYEKNAFLQGKS